MDASPEAKQSAIYYALCYSDEYIWTWHGTFNEWIGELPPGEPSYMQYLESGRKAPAKIHVSKLPPDDPRIKFYYRAEQDHDPTAQAAVDKLLAGCQVL